MAEGDGAQRGKKAEPEEQKPSTYVVQLAIELTAATKVAQLGGDTVKGTVWLDVGTETVLGGKPAAVKAHRERPEFKKRYAMPEGVEKHLLRFRAIPQSSAKPLNWNRERTINDSLRED